MKKIVVLFAISVTLAFGSTFLLGAFACQGANCVSPSPCTGSNC